MCAIARFFASWTITPAACQSPSATSTTCSASVSRSSAMPLAPPANSIGSPSCQPELAVLGALAGGEVVEHVLVVDDAVLEDLDERRALVGVRGLQHVGQVLRHVEAAGDEARARAEREGAGRAGRSTEPSGVEGLVVPIAAGRRILALGQAVDLVVEQQDLAVRRCGAARASCGCRRSTGRRRRR